MGVSELIPATDLPAVPTHSDRTAATTWCTSGTKRAFDCALALLMLMALLPCMGLVALVVAFSSREPVLFRQRRVGLDGQEFELLKFRTMSRTRTGPGITRSGDSRITRVGGFLRSWKLDEFPQLINVIRGEMSLVGPRPDLPQYIAQLRPQHLRILTVRPGITGAASTAYRDEEQVLSQAPVEQLERFYVSQVLPNKAEMDWEYACRATMLSDLGILLKTIRVL